MRTIKKMLTLMMLVIGAFVFFSSVTEMPTDVYAQGGTYCDVSAAQYCWTSLPDWVCITSGGGVKCADPVVN